MLSSEMVVNVALRRIGYPIPIGSLYEGSPASRAALDVYAETVWTLLRAEDQEFSRKVAALTTTGNTAPLGWTTEFQYPADCLRVRTLSPTGGTSNNPLPIRWDVGTTLVSAVQTTVIWSSVSSGSLVYTTSSVTEDDWNSLFTELVVQKLAMSMMGLAPKADGKEKSPIPATMQLASDRDS